MTWSECLGSYGSTSAGHGRRTRCAPPVDAVKVGEQVGRVILGRAAAGAAEIVDDCLRVDLLLDIEGGAWTMRSDQSC